MTHLLYDAISKTLHISFLLGVGRFYSQSRAGRRPNGVGRGGRGVRGQDVETPHLRDRVKEVQGGNGMTNNIQQLLK